jgi:hypothetical protein
VTGSCVSTRGIILIATSRNLVIRNLEVW